MSKLSESKSVETKVTEWLSQMGWTFRSADDLKNYNRLQTNAVIEPILVEKVKEKKSFFPSFKSGVISFSRPLPSIKHEEDYSGDLTTLTQRLEKFEKIALDFAIIVNFDESFASMMGTDFLNILKNICNMELIAEGIDFRCGYKGATDSSAIRYWAKEKAVDCVFVDSVYYQDKFGNEERVSSSYIRKMIEKGFFTVASELLEGFYELDLDDFRKIGKTRA